MLSLSGETPAKVLHLPVSYLTTNMKYNVSPDKKLRNLRRLLNFCKNKTLENKPKLAMRILPSFSFSPKAPILSISETTHVDISPVLVQSSQSDLPMITTRTRMNRSTNLQTVPPYCSLDDVYASGVYERNRENVQNTLKLIDAALIYRR